MERDAIHRVAFGSELIEAVTTGRITKLEWAVAIGESLQSPGAATEFITTIGTIDQEMIELVTTLRSKGLLTAILTNGTNTVTAELATLGVIDHFHVVFNTAEIGVVKPDPAVYHHVLEELRLTPRAVFFTDDRPANVSAADHVGIHGHHFTGIESLRAALIDRGVRLD